MKKLIIAIAIFHLYYIHSRAQSNLVLNPSFELIDSCPNQSNQLFLAHEWDKLRNGGGGTPDLFNECCIFPFPCGIPNNWSNKKGYQYAKTGIGYAGIITFNAHPSLSNFREFVQGKLTGKLVQGKSYCVSFYLSHSEYSQYSCISLGAYLDNGQIYSVNDKVPFPYITPQLTNSIQQLDDTLNWILIQSSFTATGSEEYITIGNFAPDSLSGVVFSYPLLPGESPASKLIGAYYYIDDVSVIDISTPAYAGNDTIIQAGDSVFIGRQPEVGLNEACIWFANGTPIDTIAGLWVTPDTTTTYILQQTLCGNISYDTVTVTMDFDVGIAVPPSGVRGSVRLYPNPASNEIKIESTTHQMQSISVYDITGRKCYGEQLIQPTHQKVLPLGEGLGRVGLYIVETTLNNGSIVRNKFIKH